MKSLRRLLVLLVAFFALSPSLFPVATVRALGGPGLSVLEQSPFIIVDCEPSYSPNTKQGDVVGLDNQGHPIIAAKPGCGIVSFLNLIRRITKWGIFLTIPLATIFIVYAGFVILFSYGSVEKVKSAQKSIRIALTGVIIALLSWLIINGIYIALTGSPVAVQFVPVAFAQGCGGGGPASPYALTNPLGTTCVTTLLKRIANYGFVISIPVTVLMIVIGAFQLLFSAGNAEKVKAAGRTITYSLVAFVVIMLSVSLVNLLWYIINTAAH